MKKKTYLTLFSISLILFSCSNDDYDDVKQSIDKYPEVVLPTKTLQYDAVYEVENGVERDITDEYISKTRASSHESYEITPLSVGNIFPGSVLNGVKINEGGYAPVGIGQWVKDVTISYSLPIMPQTIKLSKSSLSVAILNAVGDKNFTGQQSQKLTYKMKQFSYYNELKLVFGSNLKSLGGIFTVDVDLQKDKTTAKSALFIDFSQTYFSVYMDYPEDGNIFKDEATRNKFLNQNPVYVSTVNYGRKGILLVESEYSYEETSLAIRAAFKAKVVSGSLDLTQNEKKILERANIQICIIGGQGGDAAETIRGFAEFQDYIIKGGIYNLSVFGVPISYEASYADDNSLYFTEFKTGN